MAFRTLSVSWIPVLASSRICWWTGASRFVWLSAFILFCTQDCAYALIRHDGDRYLFRWRQLLVVLDQSLLMSEQENAVGGMMISSVSLVTDDLQRLFSFLSLEGYPFSHRGCLSFDIIRPILVTGLWLDLGRGGLLLFARLVPLGIVCSAPLFQTLCISSAKA